MTEAAPPLVPQLPSAELKRGVRMLDLIMLGAGTAIGAAIFTVLGPAAKVGGAGILIATGVAALPMVLFALVYAWLASTAPATAASYEWQRRFTHPAFAFGIVWMRVLANAVVMIVYGQTLTNYLQKIWDFPAKPVMLAFFTLLFAVNYIGVAVAARVQTLLMLGLLVVLAGFVVSAGPHLQPHLFADALAGGWLPIAATLPLMIQLFLGIETSTEVGEEVEDAERVVPLSVAGALALTVVVYLSVAFAALSLIGPTALAASKAPLLDAAKAALGGWATPVIVAAATLALTKSMNATFLVYSRFLFAMGRAGSLPAPLGRIHPRFGTPYIATTVAFAASCAGLLLPTSLLFLLLAVSVPTMLKYMGTCIAAWNAADKHPEVVAQARLKFSPGLVKVLAVLGVVAAIVIAALGVTTDIRPYGLIGGWLAAGMAYYLWRRRRLTAAA
ncbi:APC family permease [Phenylobacterium sp.]|jgi:APA family basic amino acid/polyamine antiporter|uniref:APC family permease n=1 Tax=Phenylobacterium sp. TaxID=1871053 RepID=UPI002E36CFD7|nr:amino acid permease [Phenylobacterium sp.]HEX3366332.1 amino acid permease [Phenylobacterium sp.]